MFLLNIFAKNKIFNKLPKANVAIVGYFLENDGIGKITYSIYDSLSKNFDVSFISSRPGMVIPNHVKVGLKNKYYDVVIFNDAIGYNYYFMADNVPDGKLKICYSMFESSEIPYEWVNYINKKIDIIIVPNKYLSDVYKTSGVNKKIIVLEPGIKDLEDFLSYKKKKRDNKKFTFTYSSTFLERKNHLNLLKSFFNAFGNSDDFQLVLHGRGAEESVFKKIKEFIDFNKITNVKLILKNLDRQEYISLIAESDCYVAISKGEGFSITPRESLAAGVPTIVSNNTVQKTLCESNRYIKIESPIAQPADYKLYFGRYIGYCFDIDINDLSEKLKEVFNNYDYYFKKAQLDRSWLEFYKEKRFFIEIEKVLNNLLGMI
jgi:glycosyltransferase involved in cell wall biosynthesis